MDDKIWKEYGCPDSLSFTAILDDRDRVSIPASIRREMKIKPKSVILIKIYRRIEK